MPFASGFGVLLAPLSDHGCVKTASGRDSSACPAERRQGGNKAPCGLADPKTCSALHFPIPGNWTAPGFDDAAWPPASIYRPEEVTSTPGYVRHAALFGSGEFIWTRNLLLDNLVLARHTAKGPGRR